MRRLLHTIVLVSCLIPFFAFGSFDTLSELIAYAHQLPEAPENEYIDPYKPQYNKLYKSLSSREESKLFSELQKRLKRLAKDRELKGFYGDFVQKFYIDVETKWYIWGPLHGAFHSLIRSLEEMREQGVINDNLRIIKPRFNVVFNGNILNYAPYQLETLSVLLSLLEKNPDQMFIIKGAFEQVDRWRKSNFKDELINRIGHENEISFSKEIDTFFNTFPLALYLISTENDVVRISFFKDHPLLTEEKWNFFFNQKVTESKKIKDIPVSDEKVKIKARIIGHAVKEYPYEIQSLTYAQEDGIHTWQLFSSPLKLFQQMFNFYEDAVAVLTTGKFFFNWKIALYRHQLGGLKGFIRAREFNLATGKEEFTADQEERIANLKQNIQLAELEQERLDKLCQETVSEQADVELKKELLEEEKIVRVKKEEPKSTEMALQGNTLVVGTLQDLSKSLKDLGVPFRNAMLLVINDFNDEGGAHGLKIRMVSLDDQYSSKKARALVEQFLDVYKTDIILGAQGTPTLTSYLDLIKEKKILSIFPFTGAFHNMVLPYFIRLRASYVDVGNAVTTFMIKNKGAKKFAFFYQDDQFGKDNLNGALKALKKAGIKEYLAVPYDAHKPNLEKQANDIRQFNPDALGLLSVPFSSEKLLNRFDIKWLLNVMLFTNEFHGIEQFKTFIQKKGKTVTSAHVWPNPKTADMPIVKEYRARMKRAGFPLNDSTLEGYITSSVFLDIFKKMEMPFTKERFIDQVHSVKDYDFKGLRLNFNPKTGQLFNTIWIDTGEGQWIKQEKIDDQTTSEQKIEEQVGVASDRLVQNGVLVLANTSDFSKGLKHMSDALRRGMDLKLNEIAAQGGINGVKLRMSYLDDGYVPKRALNNVKVFLNDVGTNLLVASVGTPTLEAYVDLVKTGEVAAIFPFTGSSTFRNPTFKYMIHYRSSYDRNVSEITKKIVERYSPKKVALFYQNDTFGIVPAQAVRKVLKEKGVTDILDVSFERNNVDFGEQANKIEAFDPDVIGFFGPSISAEELIKRMDLRKVSQKILYGLSWMTGDLLQNFLRSKGLKMIIPNLVPNPKTSNVQIAREFREAADKAGVSLDPNAFEGYINISLLAYLIKQVEGPITTEKIIKVAEQIKDLDFKGISLTFDPKTRVLSHHSWIDFGQDEWEKVQNNIPEPSKEPEQDVQPDIKEDEIVEVQQLEAQPTIETKVKAGEQPEMALQDGILFLGNTSDFSRTLKSYSENLKQAMLLPIRKVNQGGGINGMRLRVVFLDDGYDGKLARENVNKLLSDFKTDILLGAMGTPTLQGYLDLVKDKKVLSVFPNTSSFRDADLPYLVHLRASNYDMGYAVTNYALKNSESKRFAFLYQDDSFGKEMLRGAQSALKEAGITEYVALPHERHDANFRLQAQEIKKFDPDGIGFFTNPLPAELLIKELRAEFLLGKMLVGSELINLLNEYGKKRGIKFVLPSVVPNPHESDLAFVREYRRLMKRNSLPVNVATLEGYMNGIVFIELLRQMDGLFSKEKFLKTVNNIKDYDFKGLTLNFNPNTRQLMNTLWLNTGGDEWIRRDLNGKESIAEKEVESPSLSEQPLPKTEEIALQDGILVIGNSSDFSKTLKDWSEFLKSGLMVPINEANKEGVNGMRFQIVALDDAYDGDKTRENIMTLLNDFKTDIVIATMGTPTLTGYIDLVKDKKVFSIFPHTSSYHTDAYPYLLHWRASNFDMGYAMTDYIIKNKDIKRFAFVYQNDLFGKELFDGAKKALEQAGITDFLALAHERHDVNFNTHVQEIKNFNPDAIGFMTNDFPTKSITRALGAPYLFGKTIFGDLVLSNLDDYFKEIGITAIYPSVVPNPKTSDLDIVKEYREQMIKNKLPLNLATLEGYINSAVFLEIISKINGPFTKQAFLNVYEGFKDYNFKGLIFNFNPKKRQLMQTIWLNTGDNNWIRKDLNDIEPVAKEDDKSSSLDNQSVPPETKDIALQDNVLVVGNITDFSKTFKGFSQLLKQGMEGPINKINSTGGINGMKIQMVYLDDAYNPKKTLQNVNTLLNTDKTDILLSAHGTSTLDAYIDLIKQEKILSIFPITGSFRDAGLKNLIFLRASFVDEGHALAKYILKRDEPLRRVAFFYQDDQFGKDLVKGAQEVLQKYDTIEFKMVPYHRNISQLKEQVKMIADFKPQALSLFGSDVVAQMLIKELGTDLLFDTLLFANRSMGKKSFKKFVADKGLHLVVTQVVPNPETSNLTIVRDFRQYAQDANVPIDSIALEGYINAALFLDLLEKIDMPFTKQKFIQAAENIKNYDFQGLLLNFDPQTRQLLHSLWIDNGEKEWEQISVD